MSDPSDLWKYEPPRLPKPRPREQVWSMRKPNGRVMECQLLNQGEYGVECVEAAAVGEFVAGGVVSVDVVGV